MSSSATRLMRVSSAFALCLTAVAACGRAPDSRGMSAPATGWFVDKAAASGLVFNHFNGMSGAFYEAEIFSPGVALFDYDNDGDLDAYMVQGQMLGAGRTIAQASFPPGDFLPLTDRLYRNDLTVDAAGRRTLHFTDVTTESGINVSSYGMGVAAGDIDNDGWVDLYLTRLGPNVMLHNNGDGTFTDVSRRSGTDDSAWSVSAAFVDIDRDGWLDLYVGNYLAYSTDSDEACSGITGQPDYCPPAVYRPSADRLYRNRGNGTFVDVTARALVQSDAKPALGVSTADFNGDGWMDIYVANDGTDNVLWLNQHNGTFRNMALLAGVALTADGDAEASMGVDAGDFDNDGDEDLFIANLTSEGSTLYRNDGSGLFTDEGVRSGIRPASLAYTGFGAAWLDADNDGWLDVLTVNGAVRTIEALVTQHDPYPLHQRPQLFRNLGDGRFTDVSREAGAAFERSTVARGAAFGDVDNDGDVDVLVGNSNGPVSLLVNEVGQRNHWMGLRVIGRPTQRPSTSSGLPGPAEGRDMLGARVSVSLGDGRTVWRRVRSDGSYASANDPRVIVGLGASATVSRVRVTWPSGRNEEWTGLPADTWTTLTEGSGHDAAR
ncbi:MAG: CRTAC1 family protein [Vicinamibacterales bacterium]